MTGRDELPGTDPETEDSVGASAVGFGPRPIPSVGVWVGPSDEPARYERLEHVGGGAEGAIHRGRFVGRGGPPVPVAIKQYRPPPGAPATWPHDGTWHQIRDQAWLLAGLPRDDHLVRVREVFLGAVSAVGIDHDPAGTDKSFDTPFVVMEWIDGSPPDALVRTGEVALDVRLSWVEDLAVAVDVLHSLSRTRNAPLVHADIKPANCLVTPDRGLVLVDTGAVQRADGLGRPPWPAQPALRRARSPGRSRAPPGRVHRPVLPRGSRLLLPHRAGPAERRATDLPGRRSCSAVELHGRARAAAERSDRPRRDAPQPGAGAAQPASGATDWARELRRIAAPPVRRTRRRPVAVGLAAVAVVAGIVGTSALLGGLVVGRRGAPADVGGRRAPLWHGQPRRPARWPGRTCPRSPRPERCSTGKTSARRRRTGPRRPSRPIRRSTARVATSSG